MRPLTKWALVSLVSLAAILALANCTIVTGDAQTGQIAVYTLMTSRQDVTVERLPDGTARWKAAESKADTTAATTALNLSSALATFLRAPVVAP
jgi:hypothetical protein